MSQKYEKISKILFFVSGGLTDSDTGVADPDGKLIKKRAKKERKKTANLGPRIKVRMDQNDVGLKYPVSSIIDR